MEDKKKLSAITAAINAYIEEESAPGIRKQPVPEVSLWRASGRQEIMMMSNLWQRRIVPLR
ncbi:MAG: hypothetical protein R6U89_04465 [Dehalococcoidia bacterium]